MSNSLYALSALDGRYSRRVSKLGAYVSEAALIAFRIKVEVLWLRHLLDNQFFTIEAASGVMDLLHALSESVPDELIHRIKVIESETNHDVKAVEYALREALKSAGASAECLSFIHFALTSEDVNNAAYGLMQKELIRDVVLKQMQEIEAQLLTMVKQFSGLAMLSRTHGQSASPTTLGKEITVFCHRLRRVRLQLQEQSILGKFNGAVGNFNAHLAAFPQRDWLTISREFVEQKLGLRYNCWTTQIENHDSFVETMDHLRRHSVIAIGLCRDIWSYISLGYFRLRVNASEVGSSTMPHKVNPIDFENAEGNFGVAQTLCQHYGEKLPISRWQRDLSDSTVLRTLGTAVGHWFLANSSLLQGLKKLAADEGAIQADLEHAFEVLAEPIQTVMRRYGVVDAYERLKALTRGHAPSKADLHRVIQECSEIPAEEKVRLMELTPSSYIGAARELCEKFIEEAEAR